MGYCARMKGTNKCTMDRIGYLNTMLDRSLLVYRVEGQSAVARCLRILRSVFFMCLGGFYDNHFVTISKCCLQILFQYSTNCPMFYTLSWRMAVRTLNARWCSLTGFFNLSSACASLFIGNVMDTSKSLLRWSLGKMLKLGESTIFPNYNLSLLKSF